MAKRRGNNEGTIFQRSDGKWRAQVYLNGKRLSFTGKTQKECQDWIRRTRIKIEHGLTYSGDKLRLSEYLEEWIVSINSSKASNTIQKYSWTIEKKIVPYLGNIKLRDLGPARIQHFYNFLLTEKKLSHHAVYNVHKVLRTALYQAVKLGLMIRNPCAATTPPRPKTSEMKFFNEHQVQIFLNAAQEIGDRYYPLYFLAIHTGMRLGELLGLKWQDIDFTRRTLLVQRQVLFPKGGGFVFAKPKSKSGVRTIILGQLAIQVLDEQLVKVRKLAEEVGQEWEDQDLVFPSHVGTPVRHCNLRREYYKVTKASGLPRIRFHDLRHTAASLMLNNGIPVIVASRRLGHTKASITMDVYGHMLPNKQEEAAQLMDDLMSPIEVTNCTIFAPKTKRSS
jgi:integrase